MLLPLTFYCNFYILYIHLLLLLLLLLLLIILLLLSFHVYMDLDHLMHVLILNEHFVLLDVNVGK